MKKELIKLANHLDRIGLAKEADYIDSLLKKVGSEHLELEARKELHNFIENLENFSKQFTSEGPAKGHILETILRDFEKYLDYLNNANLDDNDMARIDMMKREYPNTASLDENVQKGFIEQVIERIKDIINPNRYDDNDPDHFH